MKLNRQQLLNRRRAGLLSELETAAGMVLADVFSFGETAVTDFLEKTRATYRLLPKDKGRLSDIAVRFGLAAGQVLMKFSNFNQDMVDLFLLKLVEQGQEARRNGI